jgi:hypothetical protein
MPKQDPRLCYGFVQHFVLTGCHVSVTILWAERPGVLCKKDNVPEEKLRTPAFYSMLIL